MDRLVNDIRDGTLGRTFVHGSTIARLELTAPIATKAAAKPKMMQADFFTQLIGTETSNQ